MAPSAVWRARQRIQHCVVDRSQTITQFEGCLSNVNCVLIWKVQVGILQGASGSKRKGGARGPPCLLGAPLPFVDSASFISKSDSHCAVFIQVKLITIQVIVWSNPSNPDAGGVLPSKDADGIVALLWRDRGA